MHTHTHPNFHVVRS